MARLVESDYQTNLNTLKDLGYKKEHEGIGHTTYKNDSNNSRVHFYRGSHVKGNFHAIHETEDHAHIGFPSVDKLVKHLSDYHRK